MGKSRLLLLHDILHEHTLQQNMLRTSPTLVWTPMLSNIDCRRGSRVSLRVPALSRDTFPSAIPVVRAYSSASAELGLTDSCVRSHAEKVAFLHCTIPPLVLLQVMGWLAQSLSVFAFTVFRNVMISITHFALGALFMQRVLHVCSSRRSQWDTGSFVLFLSRCT